MTDQEADAKFHAARSACENESINNLVSAAVAAERDRCAKVCDQAADFYGSDLQNVDFAARIALTGLVDALKIVAKQIRRGGAE